MHRRAVTSRSVAGRATACCHAILDGGGLRRGGGSGLRSSRILGSILISYPVHMRYGLLDEPVSSYPLYRTDVKDIFQLRDRKAL